MLAQTFTNCASEYCFGTSPFKFQSGRRLIDELDPKDIYQLFAPEAIAPSSVCSSTGIRKTEGPEFCPRLSTEVGPFFVSDNALASGGDPDSIYAKGISLILRGQHEEAIRYSNLVLCQRNDDAKAWIIQGVALFYLSRHEEAFVCFDRAVTLDENRKEAPFFKGVALCMLHREEEAIVWFERAIFIDPNFKEAWCGNGVALYTLHREKEALRCLDRTISIDDRYAKPWIFKGLAHSNLGEEEDAFASFDRAVQIDKNDTLALLNKGVALCNLGDREQGIACFRRAIVLDRNFKEAYLELAIALYHLDQKEEAVTLLESAISIDENFQEAHRVKGSALCHLHREEEAVACFDHAIAIDENDKISVLCKGFALFTLHRVEDAVACYNLAIAIDGDLKEAWYHKGDALFDLCHYEDSLECYDRAIEIDDSFAEAWNNRGNVLYVLGRNEEAIHCYDRTIALNTRLVFAWGNKGEVLFRLFRKSEAKECLHRAIEEADRVLLSTDDKSVYAIKGRSLHLLGRDVEANECFEMALDPAFPSEQVWWLWGDCFRCLGKLDQALECYNRSLSINSHSAWAWEGKAVALFRLARLDESLDSINQSLTIHPRRDTPWVHKACVLFSLNQKEDAIGCLTRAITINLRNVQAWKQKLEFLEDVNKKDDIDEWHRQARNVFGEEVYTLFKDRGFPVREMDWNTWFSDHVDDMQKMLSQRCKSVQSITTQSEIPVVEIILNKNHPDFSNEQLWAMQEELFHGDFVSTYFGSLFDSCPVSSPRFWIDTGVVVDNLSWDVNLPPRITRLSKSTRKSPLASFQGWDGHRRVLVVVLPEEPDEEITVPDTVAGLPTIVWNPGNDSSVSTFHHAVPRGAVLDVEPNTRWTEFLMRAFDEFADRLVHEFTNIFAVTYRLGEPCVEIWLYAMEYMCPEHGQDSLVSTIQEYPPLLYVDFSIVVHNERPFEEQGTYPIPSILLDNDVYHSFWGISKDDSGTWIQDNLYFPHVGSPVGIDRRNNNKPSICTLGCFLDADGDLCPFWTRNESTAYALTTCHDNDEIGCHVRTVTLKNEAEPVLPYIQIGVVADQTYTPELSLDVQCMDTDRRKEAMAVPTEDAALLQLEEISFSNIWSQSNALEKLSGPLQRFHSVVSIDAIPLEPFPVWKLGCATGQTRGRVQARGKHYAQQYRRVLSHYGTERCCTRVLVVSSEERRFCTDVSLERNKSEHGKLFDDPDMVDEPDTIRGSSEAGTSNPTDEYAPFSKRGDSGSPVFDERGLLYGFVLAGNHRDTSIVSLAEPTLQWAKRTVQKLRKGATSSVHSATTRDAPDSSLSPFPGSSVSIEPLMVHPVSRRRFHSPRETHLGKRQMESDRDDDPEWKRHEKDVRDCNEQTDRIDSSLSSS